MISMNIYIAHKRDNQFQKELYKKIRESSLSKAHNIILPHENSNELFNSKEFLKKDCNLVIAEVSEPSTGMGIELGWANMLNIPIICIYKSNTIPSSSIKAISKSLIPYDNKEYLIEKLTSELETF